MLSVRGCHRWMDGAGCNELGIVRDGWLRLVGVTIGWSRRAPGDAGDRVDELALRRTMPALRGNHGAAGRLRAATVHAVGDAAAAAASTRGGVPVGERLRRSTDRAGPAGVPVPAEPD